MDAPPIDYEPQKIAKQDEKFAYKQMGDFAAAMSELQRTHVWCEKTSRFVQREAV